MRAAKAGSGVTVAMSDGVIGVSTSSDDSVGVSVRLRARVDVLRVEVFLSSAVVDRFLVVTGEP